MDLPVLVTLLAWRVREGLTGGRGRWAEPFPCEGKPPGLAAPPSPHSPPRQERQVMGEGGVGAPLPPDAAPFGHK